MPNPGITIADAVQSVWYQVYKVRLDTKEDATGLSWHSKTNKFKEVVMELNLVIDELQRTQDWNWLRDRWDIGVAEPGPHPQEFEMPDGIYKVCHGYGDAIRLHKHGIIEQIPLTSPRQGNRFQRKLYNNFGEYNTVNTEQQAMVVGDTLAMKRPWFFTELGGHLETDVIRRMDHLHICDDNCPSNCPKAYKDKVFTEMPDYNWIITRAAAKRAEADPSVADRVQSLNDEAKQQLSSLREDDTAGTTTDYWETEPLGFVSIF